MVKVSAVMIDVIPELVDIPVPTGLAGAKNSTNDTPPLAQQMTSEDDLSADEEVVADSKFRDTMVGGPTSMPMKIAGLTVDFAGDVTVGVSSPADHAGDVTVVVASSTDLAGDVTVGVASSADLAKVVTVGVASSGDLAGDVTVTVSPQADLAGDVTIGVASSADLAEDVIVGVASSADPASVVTAGLILLNVLRPLFCALTLG